MKSRTTVILGVLAIVCGLAASYGVSRLLSEREPPPEEEKVSVLVAKQNLSMGFIIKEPEKYFEQKQFTKGQEPRKAIKGFEELKDKYLQKSLSAEQFVTLDDLLDKDSGFTSQMTKGKRAFSIKVNPDTAVAGFVLPHSKVDVVAVTKVGDRTLSKIILQNVLVLAVD